MQTAEVSVIRMFFLITFKCCIAWKEKQRQFIPHSNESLHLPRRVTDLQVTVFASLNANTLYELLLYLTIKRSEILNAEFEVRRKIHGSK